MAQTYMLTLPVAEIAGLLRAETRAAHGQPELNTSAWREYVIEKGFKGRAYGIYGFSRGDLVVEVSTLSIEPRVERDYWILQAIVERPVGPLSEVSEDVMGYAELTFDAFEAALHARGRKRTKARLDVETPAARRHFDRWLAEMRHRHGREPQNGRQREAASAD